METRKEYTIIQNGIPTGYFQYRNQAEQSLKYFNNAFIKSKIVTWSNDRTRRETRNKERYNKFKKG